MNIFTTDPINVLDAAVDAIIEAGECTLAIEDLGNRDAYLEATEELEAWFEDWAVETLDESYDDGLNRVEENYLRNLASDFSGAVIEMVHDNADHAHTLASLPR